MRMRSNSLQDHIKAPRNAAQNVAKESTVSAIAEASSFYEPDQHSIYKIGISIDGIWRRRGFMSSSSYSILSALSIANGKVLDTEAMPKERRHCKTWEGKENSAEFAE